MSGEERKPGGAWERALGFFVDNKLVVYLLLGLLAFGGLMVAPFDVDLGPMERKPVPVDAIPDIGENQQIVFTDWPGRSPKDVEDQITYPLTTALLGIPKVKEVRSRSMFGFSSIYVIFEEEAGFYWSRSRLLEKLSSLPEGLVPDGVSPILGPDATALGQVFWYTLEGRDKDGNVVGGWGLDELRSIQDWTVRYALQGVSGVSEVASIGGFVREYQVDVNPEALAAHGVSIQEVAGAVRESNMEVGARTLEINRAEYMVRSRGYVENLSDLEEAVVAVRDQVPIRVRDVARVSLGPAARRGALDDAGAEAVGGVVVARYGENPLQVIERVKERIEKLQPGLPKRTLDDGTVSQVTIVPFYDRTELIHQTLATLSTALWQQVLITIVVVLVLLRHLRSSALISAMLPLAVVSSFFAMKLVGIDANIMSLAGIAIAIGTMVDMGIILVENIVRHLEEARYDEPPALVIRRAAAEVIPAIVTAALTTVVSFLPVFALTAAEGKLFRPLAFTKTFALGAALLLAVAAIPALAHLLFRRRPTASRSLPAGPARIWDEITSLRHFGDWALLFAGLGIAWFSVPVAVLVVLLAAGRLVGPLVPPRWARAAQLGTVALAAAGVTLILADNWHPLGIDQGLALNFLFVAGAVALLLGAFAVFQRAYPAILDWCLAHKGTFLLLPAALLLFGAVAWRGFGEIFGWLPGWVRRSAPIVSMSHAFPGFDREFMPSFDEGSFLYMPTTGAHVSFGQSLQMLQKMDAAVAEIPEVDRVVGKLGRVDSPLDPAPVSMFENVITYVPEYGVNEDGERVRQWRDHIETREDIWDEIVASADLPGLTSAPKLQPIETRLVMLQTGMRAPMGLKVYGPDLESIERAGVAIEEILKGVPGIKPETVVADRIVGKPYLEIEFDRDSIGRFGLTVADVQETIQVALGGKTLTRTVEGRERYPVRVRYMREERDSVEALRQVLVAAPSGEQVPIGELADIEYVRGPQVIKSEDTFKLGYVLFDKIEDVGEVDVVERADEVLSAARDNGELELPDGVHYEFAGNYENQVRSEKRLLLLIPIALAVVFVLLYLQFRSTLTAVIVYTGVLVAVAGGFLFVWLYGQPWFLDLELLGTSMRELFQVGSIRMSVAVWVGVIALIGLATDNGVVLATYLRQQFSGGSAASREQARERVKIAGERRVRPCLMTTATTVLALLPVITSTGKGADVMVPMAIPILGGMLVGLLNLFVVPVLYCMLREREVQATDGP